MALRSRCLPFSWLRSSACARRAGTRTTGARDHGGGGRPRARTWHGHFVEATFENWESEFLQMGAFVLLTVFLVQKGSAESKDPDDGDRRDEDPRAAPRRPGRAVAGAARRRLARGSTSTRLLIAFVVLFVGSFVGHAVGGAARVQRRAARARRRRGVGAGSSCARREFWFESFQNWQSEFLAVGAIVVLSIFLRQRGSPESKPVHAPHAETGD